MMFSTKYQDNDIGNFRKCAVEIHSDWWYRYCHIANPDGKDLAGRNEDYNVGITYEPWRCQKYLLKFTQFMVPKV